MEMKVPDLETLPTDFQEIGTELVKEAQKKRPDANQVLPPNAANMSKVSVTPRIRNG